MTENADLSFEKRLEALEALVNRMEEGGLSLKDTMASFEKGMAMARALQEELDGYRARLQQLEGGELRPLEDGDGL